jgi:menaquinone-9 beta-reductase
VVRGNVALVGDASGSADAITGEGLAMGFRQAKLLAEAVSSNNLSLYQAGHGALLRLPQTMARAMLLMDRWHSGRARTLRAFAREPRLFASLLRVHMGEESLPHFLFRYAPQLGRRIILPSAA